MKGENILYNNVVPSSIAEQENGGQNQRINHLDRRSDKIASRYYYHSTICRLRYDDCLMNLRSEFDLETDTLIGYLKKRLGFLNSLVNRKVTTAQLRRTYPYYDWSGKAMAPPKEAKITPAGSLELF